MPEIKSVIVTTANPIGRGDLGQCEEGFYVVEGDVLTMVTATGEPLRGVMGERITARLTSGEEARGVAKRLTLGQWRSSGGERSDFHRPLRYSKMVY
jgi:hypothetical protein